MEINIDVILQHIEELYNKYEVDTKFLDALDDEKKIIGMKGVLAELDIKKNKDYTTDDLRFIQQIYSMFC